MKPHINLRAAARQAMLDRGFRPDFEPAVEAELAALRRTPDPAPSPGVRDLRSLLWSSIDEVESRDLDQIEVAEAL
ncbi:MAG TPA: RNB domain-containing ribonuclease, partial [Vicinamibacteria bacterium]